MLAILIIAAVILLALAGLYAAYYKVFYSPKKDMSETEAPDAVTDRLYRDAIRKRTQSIRNYQCEYLKTRSRDGLRLSGRYYEGDIDKPLCICFHGYHGAAVRDFSGIGLYLIQERYNVILADQRAHWRSQGHTISFGVKERYDVLSWVRYANKIFGDDIPIYLFGISMGGGTVVMASGLDLPENVKGIVADCPYNSPKDIIKHVCRKMKLNPEICWPIIWLSAITWGRFNINTTTAAREARKAKVPILIIHGEADDFVPMRMSKEIAAANPQRVEMHTVPNADHGLSYYYDPEGYHTLVNDFFKKTNR